MGTRRVFAKVILLALGSIPLIATMKRAVAAPGPGKGGGGDGDWNGIRLRNTVTCPVCHWGADEVMSRESVKRVYHCPNCLAWSEPRPGDHCIYDSYGAVKCPALQLKALGPGKPRS